MELNECLTQLYEMKAEYRKNRKEFKDKNKHLLDTIKSLENIVTEEVLKLGKTVTAEGIRAEYKPTVVIRMKKEQNDGE